MPMRPAGESFERLVRVMRALRAPSGCAWDREQTFESLRPFVLEETYELLDAIDRGDLDGLREELGDFLYEAVFLAQIAEEAGHFSIGDAIDGIAAKLVGRHPHVFAPDGTPLGDQPTHSADEIVKKWEDLKAAERQATGRPPRTLLSGIPRSLPALLRAFEMTARAATVGFDWRTPEDVLDKVHEELLEIAEAQAAHPPSPEAVEAEVGDWLFACANYARKLGVEPEAALRRAGEKFHDRFTRMETIAAARGQRLADLSLDEQNTLWDAVKGDEASKQ